MKPVLFLAVAIPLACGGCPSEPRSCDEARCDPSSEYCILYGSDTLAPPSAGCHALPATCVDDRTCACLQRETPDLEFCFDAGGCTVPGGAALELVCPGG